MANNQTIPTPEATENAAAARKIQQAVQAQTDAPAEPETTHAAYDVTQDTAPVPKAVLKRKNWFARHKVLTVVLALVLLLVAFVAYSLNRAKAAAADATYQFVRTTTLQKTSLDNSVTATGTVLAGSTASVTVSDSAKLYKVTEVPVKVGDEVKEGDVIARLDTTDVLKSIEKAQQDYTDTLTSAQTSYTRTLDDYNTAVVEHENKLIDLQAKIDEADENVSTAQTTADDAQIAYDTAANNYNTIKAAYDTATSQLTMVQQTYDATLNDLNSCTANANAAYTAYTATLNAAWADYNANGNQTPANAAQLVTDAQNLINAYYAMNGNDAAHSSNTINAEEVRRQVNEVKANGDALVTTGPGYDQSAAYRSEAATKALQDAQNSVNAVTLGYSSYAEIEAAVKNAEQAKTSAESTLKQANTSLDSAISQQKSAHDSYDTEKNSATLKQKTQSVEDAKTKLTQAQRTPDNLTTLQTTLENCTLTATMSGTVTALNATVGSVCTGAVATIQNTDSLTVKVTIAADKVADVATGMACSITADTTTDTVNGTLTQLDPVANEQGTFGAEVTVAGSNSGLLIGTSAQVEIMQSRTENVFVVPLDAIGTAADGSSFVYRKTGGEGVDMTFEQVTVTTGTANDYYTEISGAALAEGDVIRSSADMTEGIESSDNTEDPMAAMMNNSPMSDDDGARANKGGGTRPAGGTMGSGAAPGGM